MGIYKTIVVDPPWLIKAGGGRTSSTKGWRLGIRSIVPYPTMSVDEIAALPVDDLAAENAHLYLWTINKYVEDAYSVARAWGFKPSTLLTWCKAPKGIGLGGTHCVTTEHILFCRRGRLPSKCRVDTTWWKWKRPFEGGKFVHSKKPEGMIDLVESVSPGPYLEMFARRARLGWDYWGDESLNTVSFTKELNASN